MFWSRNIRERTCKQTIRLFACSFSTSIGGSNLTGQFLGPRNSPSLVILLNIPTSPGYRYHKFYRSRGLISTFVILFCANRPYFCGLIHQKRIVCTCPSCMLPFIPGCAWDPPTPLIMHFYRGTQSNQKIPKSGTFPATLVFFYAEIRCRLEVAFSFSEYS